MTGDHFQAIFHPRSVALIGASGDPDKYGGRAYLNLKGRSGQERYYAVNPKLKEIEGERVYGRLQEISDEIEHAIVIVPAPLVVQALTDCAEKKVRAVTILSAGFRETGSPEGARWEEEIRAIARKNGMRIIGPNCFGVYSPRSALTIQPGLDYPKKSGPLGFLSQSGGLTGVVVRRLVEMGILFSKAVSYGNACDLNECDFLSHFTEDEETRIIAAYIEGVRDGGRFLEILKDATRKKPVILWKGGLTEQGGRAAASHTASMSGSEKVWEGIFRQTGAVSVSGINELIDLIIGFYGAPDFRAKRVSVIGGGGHISVAASDALARHGISVPPFPSETRAAILAHLPPSGNSVKNPVDIGSPRIPARDLKPILEAMAASDLVDAVIVEQMIFRFTKEFEEDQAEVIPSVRDASGKPFIVSLPYTSSAIDAIDTERSRRRYRDWYLKHGIPVFDSLQQTANALGKILRYNDFKDSNSSPQRPQRTLR